MFCDIPQKTKSDCREVHGSRTNQSLKLVWVLKEEDSWEAQMEGEMGNGVVAGEIMME